MLASSTIQVVLDNLSVGEHFREWLALVYFANNFFADCLYVSHTPRACAAPPDPRGIGSRSGKESVDQRALDWHYGELLDGVDGSGLPHLQGR